MLDLAAIYAEPGPPLSISNAEQWETTYAAADDIGFPEMVIALLRCDPTVIRACYEVLGHQHDFDIIARRYPAASLARACLDALLHFISAKPVTVETVSQIVTEWRRHQAWAATRR